MNLNKENTYDAIVVGTGISGGWAAKELTEKGLKTLVLERGRDVQHVTDYPTMMKEPWELPYADRLTEKELEEFPVQARAGYTLRQSTKHWWVKDAEQPYEEVKPFDWIRGYHVGGRSLLWGRHSYRWSEMDFTANGRENVGVDWPIRYREVEKWYDYAEQFAGICGQAEGLAQLPDGKFLPPMELNCLESHAREQIKAKFDDRILTIGRVANLTQPHNGRGSCQHRNLCRRGCPYGAYFSSNAATLPAAAQTGNMTLRPHSVVSSVIYDEDKGKASGVRVIDAETGEEHEYFARIIFLNASCLNTTLIMMNSTSSRFPNGLGNDSGELGHNLMDHHFRVGANGKHEEFRDRYYYGQRPTGFYIPRFRNLDGNDRDYLRGFGYQGGASREGWWRGVQELAIGEQLKGFISNPGQWTMGMTAFGEMLPDHKNHVSLNQDRTDKWGQPTLVVDCEFGENERKMRHDMANDAAEMLEASGFKDIETFDSPVAPGHGIHEMGTARMGHDPKTSILNKWNQVHSVPNVFVTDGACMTSSACQNPSLTYMALTARAVDHAVSETKKNNL
ncbi:MAG: GMC family oxidoreductase [Balneolales bacterium]